MGFIQILSCQHNLGIFQQLLESEELYQKRLEAFQKVMLQFNDASI
jgi:hypothetical protein